ncbi:hypothetical protein FACS1894190_16310 [Spirochaetia bacterium]|nr:hypothetical protein FACS1894190_16310 [Spirochaetia bacterium]
MPLKETDEYGLIRATRLAGGQIQRTDTKNADGLVKEFGAYIRYNSDWKKWLAWNGEYWQTDEGEVQINEFVKKMVRGIYKNALYTSDYKERIAIEKFAEESESKRRINACIDLASKRQEIQIKAADLDTNLMLLNVENGTVDLSTGEFREHRPSDLSAR